MSQLALQYLSPVKDMSPQHGNCQDQGQYRNTPMIRLNEHATDK